MGERDDLTTRVLVAVVEGYAAREGLKDRIRALNEWEIARRSVSTELSYAEYLEHPLREEVANALLALQRQGLVSVWDRGAKYDSFIPTSSGNESVSRLLSQALFDVDDPADTAAPEDVGEPAAAGEGPSDDPLLSRLDEIIRLLRSIDARLAR